MKKRAIAAALCLMLVLSLAVSLTGCTAGGQKDIVVLFTNDVHCELSEGIGYDGLAAYKKAMEAKTPYVTMVDCGDHIQGNYFGVVSKGEWLIEIMNNVGYDLCTLGNHEFDYGMDQLKALIGKSDAQYVCCNIAYTGKGESPLGDVKPYEIIDYGGTKVGYVGVATPMTPMQSTPSLFMEDGEYVYTFCAGNEGKDLYDCIQQNVDACRKEGADYVILLSHLGMGEVYGPYTSLEVAKNTSGIDAILDGHSHTEAPCMVLSNQEGKEVLVGQTGTKLGNIGQLVIDPSGMVTVGYISGYEDKDADITAAIKELTARYEEEMQQVIANTNVTLSVNDTAGIRMVRSREIPIGDLCADAYYTVSDADIAMVNGGGIRADLPAGDITYGDAIAVHPFGNSLCVVEVTGGEILDMLEYFYRAVQPDYKKDGAAWGEDGSFMQVAGLKFTVNTGVKSSIVVDDTDTLVSVGDTRRVSDVMVLENGAYVPIDVNKTYTLASTNYMIKQGGCGMGTLLADHNILVDEAMLDYQVLINYVISLDGDLSRYSQVDHRITIK